MMRAIVYAQYGPPELLQLKEVAKPTPGDDQILVKVHAASINALESRRFEVPAFVSGILDRLFLKSLNSVLGTDVAGTVESVGKDVMEFKAGDVVFGVAKGTFAEYACNRQSKFALKPANVSFEQAAAVPLAAFTAIQALRPGQIQLGQKVLIYGASGGTGMFAVQIAKAFGAEVTAVCSTRSLEIARASGADHLIDYKHEDFMKNGRQYDLIVAINGYRSIFDYRRALTPNGLLVFVGGSIMQIIQMTLLGRLLSQFGSKRFQQMGTKTNSPKDWLAIQELLAEGKIMPIIDGCYPLSETPKALRYILDEHAKGKVVISVASRHLE